MYASLGHGRRLGCPNNLIRLGALLLISFLCLMATSSGVADSSQPHGSVDLIADQTSVQPARPLWVGLHFQLEKGWHIYWTNPGDSGEPPRVNWNLPTGFQAGSLLWPVPRRIEDHSLMDFGYLEEVLLPVEIRPPANLGEGANVQLRATVNWLVCREICIPARAALELTLPIRKGTPGPPSSAHSLFAQARAALPRRVPPSWKVTANLDMHQWVLKIETGKRETEATFFPLEPNQFENAAAQKAIPSPLGIRLELQKSDQLLKSPSRLTGVLVLAGGQGYLIEAPVATSK